jgi:hypothetical protein
MKVVYGISRWSNPNRAAARHIDNGEGKPLCGGMGRKAISWERDEDEPTCKRCIRLSNIACSGRLELVRVFDESEVEEVAVGEYQLKAAATNAY